MVSPWARGRCGVRRALLRCGAEGWGRLSSVRMGGGGEGGGWLLWGEVAGRKGVGRDEADPRRGRRAQAGAEGPGRRRRLRGRKWWWRRVPPGSLSRPGALVWIQIQTAPGSAGAP